MPATEEELEQREREKNAKIEKLGEVCLKILREKKPLLLTELDLIREFMKRPEIKVRWIERINILVVTGSWNGVTDGLLDQMGEIIKHLVEEGKVVKPKPGWYGLPDE